MAQRPAGQVRHRIPGRLTALTVLVVLGVSAVACDAGAASPSVAPATGAAPSASPSPAPAASSTPVATGAPSAGVSPVPSADPGPPFEIPGYTLTADDEIEPTFRLAVEASVGDANSIGYLSAAMAQGEGKPLSVVLFGFQKDPSDEAFLAVVGSISQVLGGPPERAMDDQGLLIRGAESSSAFAPVGRLGGNLIYLMVTGDDPVEVEAVALAMLKAIDEMPKS